MFEHPDFILKRAMKVLSGILWFVISNECNQQYVFEILKLNIIIFYDRTNIFTLSKYYILSDCDIRL